jgi:hypothetical protein
MLDCLFQLSSFNRFFFKFQTGKENMRGDKGMGGCYQRKVKGVKVWLKVLILSKLSIFFLMFKFY